MSDAVVAVAAGRLVLLAEVPSFSCANCRMSVAETFAAAIAPPLPGGRPAHR